jgi:hypothetical protein
LHFSEDPSITHFAPHVAATAQVPQPLVWAVDAEQAPAYWFPRACPQAMAWVRTGTTADDRERVLGPGGGTRVHAIEYGWVEALRSTQLYAYRLPAVTFQPVGEPEPHAWTSDQPVRPLAPPDHVSNLLDLHEKAGIQLRILPNLWTFWDAVTATTLAFSGIRLRNARPRLSSGGGP